MQCFNKYYETRVNAHLINAGKYMSSILIQFTNVFKGSGPNSYRLFILISVISTVYSYGWDLYMDWGLLRTRATGKRFLRDKLLYPVWFYYYAAVSNLGLRFFWVLTLLPK